MEKIYEGKVMIYITIIQNYFIKIDWDKTIQVQVLDICISRDIRTLSLIFSCVLYS